MPERDDEKAVRTWKEKVKEIIKKGKAYIRGEDDQVVLDDAPDFVSVPSVDEREDDVFEYRAR